MTSSSLPSDSDDLDPTTQDLVRSARASRPEFSKLYARVAPALFAWSRLRVAQELRSVIEAEDMVQEVCCRAYERFGMYDPDRAAFRSWLFGIANNVLRESLAQLHRRKKTTEPMQAESGANVESLPDDTTSVSRRVARDESLRALIDKIETLPDEDRRLLLYRGLEGLKHGDVARLMGLSVDTVEKRWQRIRGRLEALGSPRDLVAD